ncbi:hypothetical protein H5P28_16495 [Ruficoccus amylovorans]|uniref:DDE Tnp4 domain-containing protein n=1 Tax=Ruficoccus amylovorans TaxID=1804625 RepID=A0A842HGN6_9BACT|nr:hypothetical protein [Ruficoccus amylovorans]MBC2595865.1 hypothetical protein [Ruficoccus amylovorans]
MLLKRFGMLANICEKGTSACPLKREERRANKQKSRIRSRVEHAFGRIAQFGDRRRPLPPYRPTSISL